MSKIIEENNEEYPYPFPDYIRKIFTQDFIESFEMGIDAGEKIPCEEAEFFKYSEEYQQRILPILREFAGFNDDGSGLYLRYPPGNFFFQRSILLALETFERTFWKGFFTTCRSKGNHHLNKS